MITTFNIQKHHIYIEFSVDMGRSYGHHLLRGILDTGASHTEINDRFLRLIGFPISGAALLKSNQQTQKYDKMILPQTEICGHSLHDFPVYVSKFEGSWGIDALIGLDFFRRFRTTIDFQRGQVITEPFKNA